jgi:hypothetical protein
MEALRCCSYVVIYMNLRRVLSGYKKPSREARWIGGRIANGGLAAEKKQQRKRQISICRLRGCVGKEPDQTGEMVASAPIMRVKARNPNRKIASLAMKSPTQSVRYRVRRAGATPSGRARSSGRGWKIVRLQTVSVQTQLRQINTDQMRGVPRSPSYFSTGPTFSTPEITCRSRLAGEPVQPQHGC